VNARPRRKEGGGEVSMNLILMAFGSLKFIEEKEERCSGVMF
jgi:hypothetical protein